MGTLKSINTIPLESISSINGILLANVSMMNGLGVETNPFGTISPSYVSLIEGYNNEVNGVLICVDRNGYMWFKSNVNLYRCSIATFKANLVSIAHETETRYSFSILPNCDLIQSGASIRALRETTNGFVGRVGGDTEGKLYYFNGTSFVESSIPTNGHKGELRISWNFDAFGDRVLSSGYAVNWAVGRVLFSDDAGQTFTTIFDVETTSLGPANKSNMHIHGCHIDRWHGSRVWVLLGDYSIAITNYKVIYCDNPEAATPTWNELTVDIDITQGGNEQYCSAYSIENLVLFGSDMQQTGIYTMERPISQRKLTLNNDAGIAFIPGSWFQNELNSPVFFFNQATNETPQASQIWGTLDGLAYHKVYQDTIGHAAYSNPNAWVSKIKGDIFAWQNEGVTNLRFSGSAGCVVMGTINDPITIPTITNVQVTPSDTGCTIQVTINPNGTHVPTLYWGVNSMYSTIVRLDAISTTTTVTFTLTGLTQNTHYHFQVKCGENFSEDATFTTTKVSWIIPVTGKASGTATAGTMIIDCTEDETITATGDVTVSVVQAADSTMRKHTITVNCPNNGSGTIVIPDRSKIRSLGNHKGSSNPDADFYAGTNATMPTVTILASNLPESVTKFRQGTELANSLMISGTAPAMTGLTYLYLKGANLTLDASNLIQSGLTYLNLNSDGIRLTYSGTAPSGLNLTLYLNGYYFNWTGLDFSGSATIAATFTLANWRTNKLTSTEMVTLLTSLKNRVGGLPATLTINDYADYASVPQSVTDAIAALKAAKTNITTVNLGA